MSKSILIDAREFDRGRRTGIGRFIEGLTIALAKSEGKTKLLLATAKPDLLPPELKDLKEICVKTLPFDFLRSERSLTELSRQGADIFISPYPKLPLFGCYCLTVHTIHDVLDLTYSAYKKRVKVSLDKYRLKKALRRSDLTWYVSQWSREETEKLMGYTGKFSKVRYQGIAKYFNNNESSDEVKSNNNTDVESGHILVIGNGLPHKNLGILLEISLQLARKLKIIGVPPQRQRYWESRHPTSKAVWIDHMADKELPLLIKSAFCVAQPSLIEGYCYPPLEAMACGIPAVVSNIPVLLETTGGNAVFADPKDPKTWLEAFENLEDNENYETQVERGLKWVEPLAGNKGWQKFTSDIEELMNRI